jgi:hypothetical protein
VKCYLMVWDDTLEGEPVRSIERQTILDFLDTLPEVANWRAVMSAIFIVSDESAQLLSEKIHKKFPRLHHVISLVTALECQGWADAKTWGFIEKPRSA